jgi:hypothetical protein
VPVRALPLFLAELHRIDDEECAVRLRREQRSVFSAQVDRVFRGRDGVGTPRAVTPMHEPARRGIDVHDMHSVAGDERRGMTPGKGLRGRAAFGFAAGPRDEARGRHGQERDSYPEFMH